MKVKTIGANQGSILKASAYRSGEKLRRDKTGEVADYQRKQGVLHTEIIAPKNSPAWAKDRSQLWNKVEATDKRKNSRYAREVILALPHELDDQQNIVLVQEYVKQNFVSIGMVADIAIHVPDPKKVRGDGKYVADQRNIHAHVLLTDRPLAGQGTGEGFAKKKDRSWNDKRKLIQWRKGWADMLNVAFEVNGLEQRFDHRSYEKQGVDFIPQIHEGKVASSFRRENKKPDAEKYSEIAHKLEHNDLVKEHNQNVILLKEERQRRRQQQREKKRRDKKLDKALELSPRSTTSNSSGSDADAVQKTVQLEVVSSSPQSDNEAYSAGEGREGQEANKQTWLHTAAPSGFSGKFSPPEQRLFVTETAIQIARDTEKHFLATGKEVTESSSAVSTYRLRLAQLSKATRGENLARHYDRHTPSAMECDRIIRDFMRRRGFSNRQINLAMRRASPALYHKSKSEALIYARRFSSYLRARNRQEKAKKRQQREQMKQANIPAKNYRKGRRI